MIRELKTLVAVAREGTFAAAAHRIGLTQAAVSAQMQRLEAELGFALFDRTGRAAHLNRRGQEMLVKAQALIQMYNELGNSKPGVPASTLLTIGAIASIQRSLLPNALAQFHRQFPQCRTRIIPGLSMELVNMVDAGELDMAAIIRPPFSLQSDLTWTTLAREPYRLIAPKKMQGDDWIALLSSTPFIRYDRSSFGGRQVDRFLRQMHFVPREVCELDEQEAIVKLVANGVGVALVPETMRKAWPASVRVMDLGEHTFHRDVGLVHRARTSLSTTVEVLADLIVASSATR
ncbi:LysR substrate-binding domain-containing protein [Pseudomonas aegrilactucae]|uniref:LysR family transcriptional regulator n=1 Tax=Pseudomonas aegrilactucae TaxID=2854028 RepID=A0A9Q3AFM4_9PSED|nr:LysR substrate-binding domain-containing protein [Pseudomonas aegrilactucae]MBV6289579.1 LysR family transcriptional regulator [Pseudomonas aegrilactucae]